RIVQKTRDPHLPGAAAAELAHPRPAATKRHQPLVQKHPPFSRRRSPNRPSPYSVIVALLDPPAADHRIKPPRVETTTKCVNLVVRGERVAKAWLGHKAEP